MLWLLIEPLPLPLSFGEWWIIRGSRRLKRILLHGYGEWRSAVFLIGVFRVSWQIFISDLSMIFCSPSTSSGTGSRNAEEVDHSEEFHYKSWLIRRRRYWLYLFPCERSPLSHSSFPPWDGASYYLFSSCRWKPDSLHQTTFLTRCVPNWLKIQIRLKKPSWVQTMQ